MSFLSLFHRLFSSKSDVDIYPHLSSPIKLNNSMAFNFEFDGTVSWLNQVDYVKDPNFLFKSKKEYDFFKVNNHRFFKSEMVEIGEDNSSESIIIKLKEIKDLISLNKKKAHFYQKENFYDLEAMDNKTMNVVILNPVDFYKKIGMDLMSSLFIEMMRSSHLFGVQFSFIGSYSDLPKLVQDQINNHITSAGDRYYLNNHPYNISLPKLEDLYDYLKSYQDHIIDSSKFHLLSGTRKAYSLVGNVLNYSVSEDPTDLLINPKNFCFGLITTKNGDLIVMEINDFRIGVVDKDKISRLKKTQIFLK